MRNTFKLLSVLLLAFSVEFPLNADPLSDWQQWKKEYELTITGEGGWLSLAGLYWLDEGRNTLGSDHHNKHRFPAHAPPQVGVVEQHDGQLTFYSDIDNAMINRQRITQSLLLLNPPTRVRFGQFEFYIIQREQRYAVRLIDHQSPNAEKFSGTHFMLFEEKAIIQGKLKSPAQPKTIDVATVYGSTRKEKSAGWIEFEVAGNQQSFEAVDYGADAPLYVFFSDATSGETTYGAGRFLEVEQPDQQGNVIIDFNRAYNPPCAYTPYATCPLTPPQNRLKIPINAGELDNHAPE